MKSHSISCWAWCCWSLDLLTGDVFLWGRIAHRHKHLSCCVCCVLLLCRSFPHLVPRSRPKATPSVWMYTIERDIFPALCFLASATVRCLFIYLFILKPAQLTWDWIFPKGDFENIQHTAFIRHSQAECSPNVPIWFLLGYFWERSL